MIGKQILIKRKENKAKKKKQHLDMLTSLQNVCSLGGRDFHSTPTGTIGKSPKLSLAQLTYRQPGRFSEVQKKVNKNTNSKKKLIH